MFQSYAFQSYAFQTAGTGSVTPPITIDTHDGWIPHEAIKKFYENERLKHTKIIKTYKKLVKEKSAEELKEIVSEYASDTSKLTMNILKEIAEDKAALNRFLSILGDMENRLVLYKRNLEDENLLLAISAIV